MPESSSESRLSAHRARMRRSGLVRVEVSVPSGDAELIKRVAAGLRSGQGATRARILALAEGEGYVDPKELLMAAPLEGVDLTREDDLGREVEL